MEEGGARALTRSACDVHLDMSTHGERPEPARAARACHTDRRVVAGFHVAGFLAARRARTPNATSPDRARGRAAARERVPASRASRREEGMSMRAVRAAVVAAMIFWGVFGAFIGAVHVAVHHY